MGRQENKNKNIFESNNCKRNHNMWSLQKILILIITSNKTKINSIGLSKSLKKISYSAAVFDSLVVIAY